MNVIAIAAITFGINVDGTAADFQGEISGIEPLNPGDFYAVSSAQMKTLCARIEAHRGPLPAPRGGGSVANTLDLMVRVGVPGAIIGLRGDDPLGQRFVDDARHIGLHDLSSPVPGAVTGHDIYFRGDGTTVFTHGANALFSPESLDLEALQNARLLILDGGVLGFGPDSEAAAAQALRIAQRNNTPFVLTLASGAVVQRHRSFFAEFAPLAQWVVGNLEQAIELLQLPPESSWSEVQAAVLEASLSAIVTLDAEGVFACFQNQGCHVAAEQVPVVSSVGAGDNFLGAFLTARWRGAKVEQALETGNRLAAQVIQYDSARLPLSCNVNAYF